MRRALTTALLAAGALAGAAATASAEAPPGFGYELVSPLASRGFDYTRAWLFPDGDRALIGSELADVNSIYPAVRTADGWQVNRRALTPPNGSPLVASGTAAVSTDMSRVLVSTPRPGALVVNRLALSEPDGSWKLIGNGIRYVDGAADLSRFVVQATWGNDDEERYPDVPGRETGVFLWQDDGSADGAVTAIGDDAPRVATCGAEVPNDAFARTLEKTGVAPDARTAVLTSRAGCTDPDDGDAPLPRHVFRWHDGVTTDLSAPAFGRDGEATLVGHSDDLDTVVFMTDLALRSGDRNGADDLYRWDAASGARTRLTGAVTDGGAETLLSAIVAGSGDRVWFGTIDGSGMESLWVAARGEQPRRIATATEPDYPYPQAFDLRSDASGGNATGFVAQTTPDGTTLVFTSRTRIGGAGGTVTTASNDPGALFRATADGAVECVSCFADGSPSEVVTPGGRVDGINLMNRIISDDGRRIAFDTPSALEPDDANDRSDVYLWQDGVRTLLSGGVPGERADLATVSARGDVMFKTYARLLPWVDDDHLKVFVARIGGGLPAPRDPREECVGDGCQGDPRPRVDPPRDPSETFTGPGDVDDPAPRFPAGSSMSVARLPRAAQRKLAAGRAVNVAVRTNSAGRVTATTRFKAGRRWVKTTTSGRTLRRAGTVHLKVRLSRAARAQLARRGSLRVRVDVVHGRVAKPRRLAFVLKQPAPTRRGARA